MTSAFHRKQTSDDCPRNLKAPPCPLYGGDKPDTTPLDGGPYYGSSKYKSVTGGEIGTCPVAGCGYSVVYDATGKPLRAKTPIDLAPYTLGEVNSQTHHAEPEAAAGSA